MFLIFSIFFEKLFFLYYQFVLQMQPISILYLTVLWDQLRFTHIPWNPRPHFFYKNLDEKNILITVKSYFFGSKSFFCEIYTSIVDIANFVFRKKIISWAIENNHISVCTI